MLLHVGGSKSGAGDTVFTYFHFLVDNLILYFTPYVLFALGYSVGVVDLNGIGILCGRTCG
jgi:hypothetical protein